ncbi:uncharacterized protein V6R79_001869 [Siganus canaliculatus]
MTLLSPNTSPHRPDEGSFSVLETSSSRGNKDGGAHSSDTALFGSGMHSDQRSIAATGCTLTPGSLEEDQDRHIRRSTPETLNILIIIIINDDDEARPNQSSSRDTALAERARARCVHGVCE